MVRLFRLSSVLENYLAHAPQVLSTWPFWYVRAARQISHLLQGNVSKGSLQMPKLVPIAQQ